MNPLPLSVTVVPYVFGKPVNVWLGLLLAALVILQVLVGTRALKLPFAVHRANGFVILAVVAIHGFFGYMLYSGAVLVPTFLVITAISLL
jgi:hypothetical protein